MSMQNSVNRINRLIAQPSTPEIRKSVLRMMEAQLVDPSTAAGLRMGLELALDIIEEEFSDEPKPRATG
jgi:hypothetical protein